MRIAHNITALNAWRQLNLISDQLGKSVERISSGYRINRAADDPAGLVLSENLRAQIAGMDQALNNTQDGISMIQTAEGALTEIHSLLDSMRSLALYAANTAAVTPEAIAANQEQLDSAIDSIERIATTTSYAGKKLLDGTAGMQAQVNNPTYAQSVQIGDTVPAGAEGKITYISVQVTSAATKAKVGEGESKFSGSAATTTLSAAGLLSAGKTETLNINGVQVEISGGLTIQEAVNKINDELTANGAPIVAKLVDDTSATGASGYIYLEQQNYGSDYKIDLYDPEHVIFSSTAERTIQYGTDIKGTIIYSGADWSGTDSVNATGKGLTLVADEGTVLAGLTINLTSSANSAATYTNIARIYGSPLNFQIGANGGEIYKASISNLRAEKLGSDVAPNGLNDLKSGGIYDLFTNPQKAVEVIDQAIKDISTERAKLGAIQTNVLESNYRNLGIARENLQASESRIRDVDMAKEMMEFTKNNVLTQAATAMLAQANTLPTTVLTLLR